MKHDDPESPLSSLDSQEELSEEELEDELEEDDSAQVDELEDMEQDREGDDFQDLSDEESPLPGSSKKNTSMKRKRPGRL